MIILFGAEPSSSARNLVKSALGVEGWQFAPSSATALAPTDGNVILLMGSAALKVYQAAGVYPKNIGIEGAREKPRKTSLNSGFVLATYSPKLMQSEADAGPKITWDLRLARRLEQTGSTEAVIGNYHWIDTPQKFLAAVREIIARAKLKQGLAATLDTETMGLVPYQPGKKIVTVQISAEEGTGFAIHLLNACKTKSDHECIALALQELMNCPQIKLRGANLKYDLLWIREQYGVVCSNFKMDSLIVGSCLNENRSNSLSWHTKEHTEMGGYDLAFDVKYDKSEMEKVPQTDPLFLTYAAGDADAALRVSNHQVTELRKQPKLARFYNTLLHPAVRAFENIEHRGVHVDLDKFHALEGELKIEIADQYKNALNQLPKRLQMRHLDNLKLSRPKLIEDFLFTPMGLNLKPLKYTPKSEMAYRKGEITAAERKPAVDRAHLQQLRLHHPETAAFIDPYFLWKNADKMLSTYVVGFLKHLRADGKFHPTYFLFNGEGESADDAGGTDTGRLTCIAPPMQVIPKHAKKGMKNWAKLIRRCFPAPPGYVFCEFDFSQGELRIVACVAGESNMIAAYKKGMDLHCLTGAGAAGMPYEDFYAAYKRADVKDTTLDPKLAALVERFRQQAKSANFGLLYGMGVEGFMVYARDVYGVTLTMAEAQKVHTAFFKSYPGLTKYHEHQKNYAAKFGEVESPLGRVRHLPLINSSDNAVRSLAQRQAINSPIQATLTDMNIWSIAFIEQRWGDGDDVMMIGSTHDSIYGYLKADKHVELAREITAIMSNLPMEKLGWTPELAFPADCKVGPSMGDLSTLKLAA